MLATKGLFAREGCPVKIRTGGMPRIRVKKKGREEDRGTEGAGGQQGIEEAVPLVALLLCLKLHSHFGSGCSSS